MLMTSLRLLLIATQKKWNQCCKGLSKTPEALAEKNDMILNEFKIKVMLFGTDITGKELFLTINSNVIEHKIPFSYLGVLLDPMLSFMRQIEHIASKGRKAMSNK